MEIELKVNLVNHHYHELNLNLKMMMKKKKKIEDVKSLNWKLRASIQFQVETLTW